MIRFKVYEADVWADWGSYSVNMYFPVINKFFGEQLIIELADDASDDDIINSLSGVIGNALMNDESIDINIDYMYNDIIITISDNNDIEQLPIIIKLEEI